jgi:hypothetical protein
MNGPQAPAPTLDQVRAGAMIGAASQQRDQTAAALVEMMGEIAVLNARLATLKAICDDTRAIADKAIAALGDAPEAEPLRKALG